MTAIGAEGILEIDGRDMSDFDLWPGIPQGIADGPAVEWGGADIPGRAGVQVVSSEQQVGLRPVSIPCTMISNDPEWQLDRLKRIYEGAFVHVRWPTGWPDRELLIRVSQIVTPLTALPGYWDGGPLTIQGRADSPYFRAIRRETYTVRPGMETPIVPGTAPSDFSGVRIDGPAGPTINLRLYDFQGIERQKLVLSGAALLLGESLFVDGDSPYGEVTKRSPAGFVSPAYTYLQPTGHYITVQPRWSVPEDGAYCYATIDSGTAVITMRRNFR